VGVFYLYSRTISEQQQYLTLSNINCNFAITLRETYGLTLLFTYLPEYCASPKGKYVDNNNFSSGKENENSELSISLISDVDSFN